MNITYKCLFDNCVTGEELEKKMAIRKDVYNQRRTTKLIPMEQLYLESNEEVVKKFKKKILIGTKKGIGERFEDRVWLLFARMGFNEMNSSRHFTLQYSNDPINNDLTKQIDVFALDDEVCLLIECKTKEELQKASFLDENLAIGGYKEGIIKNLKIKFGSELRKIVFILCTENVELIPDDLKRLQNFSIIHMDHNKIAHYENLVSNVGHAAKYQFYGEVLENQQVPGLNIAVPAIRGQMGNHTYYSFSIEPETLLKISFISHRSSSSNTLGTYQRYIQKSRIKEIQEFINNKGYFPNSIIINLSQKMTFDFASKNEDANTKSRLGYLHLPNKYKSAFVIDGQHRLYGYANSDSKKTDIIPVIAFEELEPQEQTKMFVDINSKAKSVNKNLIKTLYSDLYWGSKTKNVAIQALNARLLIDLNEDFYSVFYNKISLVDTSEKSSKNDKLITLSYIVDYGLRKGKFFAKEIRKDRVLAYGPLWGNDDFQEKSLNYAKKFFNLAFNDVKSICKNRWNNNGFLSKNIGVASIIVILSDLLYFRKLDNPTPIIAFNKKYDAIKEMFIYLLDEIEKIDETMINRWSSKLGAGGVDKVKMDYHVILHKGFSDFNPPGLEEYLLKQSQEFNGPASQLFEKIVNRLKEQIIEDLTMELGEDNWWNEAVPERIQLEISTVKITKKQQNRSNVEFLSLSHLKDIVSENWKDLFSTKYTMPGIKGNKIDKLKWFDNLIEIEKNLEDQEQNIIEQQYLQLEAIDAWMQESLKRTVTAEEF